MATGIIQSTSASGHDCPGPRGLVEVCLNPKTAFYIINSCVLEDDVDRTGSLSSWTQATWALVSSSEILLSQQIGYTSEETMVLLILSSVLAAAGMVF